ncbi:MAG: hypothetical protein ACKO96_24365 [Flammeovirgaceae bacterium]
MNLQVSFHKYAATLLMCVASITVLKAQDLDSPAGYLEHINNQFTTVSNDMMSYTSAASHGKSARKVEKRRTEVMQSLKEAISNLKRAKPYKGDPSLRDSVVSFFQISAIVVKEDYGKIVNMEEVAEQSYDAMEAYMLAKELADEKLHQAFVKAQTEYREFAAKYNIKLIESNSKLSKKLEETEQVFKYYNRLYLIFFKSHKDESYYMKALEKSDLGALEQTKNALLASSAEGLKKASPIPSYQGDKSLKVACDRILEFYKYEVSKTADIIDYYLKKENFEKIKKAFDAKREGEKNKQDYDVYNTAVNEFNLAVNRYNSVNNELNKKRSDTLNTWNKVSSDFLDNHIPKHR